MYAPSVTLAIVLVISGQGNGFDLNTLIQGTISIADMIAMDVREIASLADSSIKTMIANLDATGKETMCKKMVEYGDAITNNKLSANGLDCRSIIIGDTSIRLDGFRASLVIDEMKKNLAIASWRGSEWMTALTRFKDGLKANDFRAMSLAVLEEMLASTTIPWNQILGQVPDLGRAIAFKLQQHFGAISTWDETKLRTCYRVLPYLDRRFIRQVKQNLICQVGEEIGKLTFVDRGKRAILSRLLLGCMDLSKARTWTVANLTMMCPFGIFSNPRVIRAIDKTVLIDFLQNVGLSCAGFRNRLDMIPLALRLRAMTSFKTATSVSSANLQYMGAFITVFGPRYVDSVPPAALKAALTAIARGDITPTLARKIVKILKKAGLLKPAELTLSDVRNYAAILVLGMSASDWASVNAAHINDALSNLVGGRHFEKSDIAVCREIMKKVKSRNSGKLGSKVRAAARILKHCSRPSDIEECTVSDLGLDPESTVAIPTYNVDQATAEKIIKKVRKHVGEPSKTNDKYGAKLYQRVGKARLACGFSEKDIEDMPEDRDFLDLIVSVKGEEMIKCRQTQLRAMAKKMMAIIMKDDKAIEELDEETIQQTGHLYPYISDEALQKVKKGPEACKAMRDAIIADLPRKDATRLKTYCLKNTVRDGKTTATDRTQSTTLDENDVTNLNNMVCGLEKEDMAKMTKDAVRETIKKTAICDMEEERATKLIDRAIETDSTYLSRSENLGDSGHLMEHLSQDKIDAIPPERLGEAMPEIKEQREKSKKASKGRDKAYRNEETKEVKEKEKGKQEKLVRTMLDKTVTESAQVRASGAARRKRASAAATCNDMQSLDGELPALSVANFTALSKDDFIDCTETFGKEKEWTKDHAKEFAGKMKNAYGDDTSKWSAETVKDCGNMVAGLSADDIGKMPLNDASVLQSIGQSDLYTAEQLSAGFVRFLDQAKGKKASALTSEDIQAMGHFACGASNSHIDDIPAAEFNEVVSSVGKLDSCSSPQKVAYLAKAKETKGKDMSAWTPSDVSDVGHMIGGATANDMGGLGLDLVAVILPDVVTSIPPHVFLGFTPGQLRNFSPQQVSGITEDQQSVLGPDQLKAIEEAGGQITVESSAGVLQYSLMLLLLSVVALY